MAKAIVIDVVKEKKELGHRRFLILGEGELCDIAEIALKRIEGIEYMVVDNPENLPSGGWFILDCRMNPEGVREDSINLIKEIGRKV